MVLARRTAAACMVAAIAALGLSACGTHSDELGVSEAEPAREGLAIPVGRIDYNVYITRQLNLSITPDKDYYRGPAPNREETLYGVFLQACNNGDSPAPTAESFKVVDNQHNEYEPVELPEDNAFAYEPRTLGPDRCIPEEGSVAQQGPTAGAMLLFRLPLDATENRPLLLEISSPFDPEEPKRETRIFELDI